MAATAKAEKLKTGPDYSLLPGIKARIARAKSDLGDKQTAHANEWARLQNTGFDKAACKAAFKIADIDDPVEQAAYVRHLNDVLHAIGVLPIKTLFGDIENIGDAPTGADTRTPESAGTDDGERGITLRDDAFAEPEEQARYVAAYQAAQAVKVHELNGKGRKKRDGGQDASPPA